jgi:membrane associated rhomboid family serine protease
MLLTQNRSMGSAFAASRPGTPAGANVLNFVAEVERNRSGARKRRVAHNLSLKRDFPTVWIKLQNRKAEGVRIDRRQGAPPLAFPDIAPQNDVSAPVRSRSGEFAAQIALRLQTNTVGIFVPLTFAASVCALSIAAGFNSPSEADLILWGASYGPRTIYEYWRLFTACFLNTNPQALALNALAIFILGRAVCQSLGAAFFCSVFFASAAISTVVATLAHPQAVIYGSSLAVSGLAGALISCLFVNRRREKIPAEALVMLVVYLLLMSFTLVRGKADIQAGVFFVAMASGFACSLFLGMSEGQILAPVAGLGMIVFAFHFALGSMPLSLDRFEIEASLSALRTQTAHEIKMLDEKFKTGDFGDTEFENALRVKVLRPSRRVLEQFAGVPERGLDSKWLHGQRAEIEYRNVSVQAMIDVYGARHDLLEADELLQKGSKDGTRRLDHFWKSQFTQLSQRREEINSLTRRYPEMSRELKSLQKGFETDFTILIESAANLEIRRTEAWLNYVREEVAEREDRMPSSLTSGEEEIPIGLDTQVSAHLERLSLIADSLKPRNANRSGRSMDPPVLKSEQSARLEQVQSYLEQLDAKITTNKE